MASSAAASVAATGGSSNLYKVGDFCYFEVSSSGPYQIRRIDELLKSNAGHVEVRATAFCRKRDLPTKLQEKIAVFEKEGKDVPMSSWTPKTTRTTAHFTRFTPNKRMEKTL